MNGHFDRVVVVVLVVIGLALDLLVLAEPQLSAIVISAIFWWRRPWSRFVYHRTPLTLMYFSPFSSTLVPAVLSGSGRELELPFAAVDSLPQPHLVGLDERKNLFIGDRLHVTDDQELLAVLHELGDILLEEGEGRVGDHDVRFFQERNALGAAEVATA